MNLALSLSHSLSLSYNPSLSSLSPLSYGSCLYVKEQHMLWKEFLAKNAKKNYLIIILMLN